MVFFFLSLMINSVISVFFCNKWVCRKFIQNRNMGGGEFNCTNRNSNLVYNDYVNFFKLAKINQEEGSWAYGIFT